MTTSSCYSLEAFLNLFFFFFNNNNITWFTSWPFCVPEGKEGGTYISAVLLVPPFLYVFYLLLSVIFLVNLETACVIGSQKLYVEFFLNISQNIPEDYFGVFEINDNMLIS